MLAAAGVLGEYVFRVYDQVKGRPVYVLKEEPAGEPSSVPLPTGRRRPPRAA